MTEPANQSAARLALTKTQRQVLQHLHARAESGLEPPSLELLCTELGLASRGSLHKHIRALIEAGFVVDLAGKQRGVRLRSQEPTSSTVLDYATDVINTRSVALLGTIAAGRPIEAVQSEQRLCAPPELLGKGEAYALRVKGDSMQNAGIHDGDWVFIEKRSVARNGEIVVALVDGFEATLKRIEQRPDCVLLHPENPQFQTQRYAPEQIDIQGVLVGLMRRY
jgi:repressor LexA